ncbi:prolyl oligopeptidase family serine peptidase [Balneolaceae bacterium YR4-1]|uniref:Prolyl oligopeptidase family serine peptidase n=1 Tax=Halalkalibaculum roseum TaxID=2709311 RepID=A0A6M1T758_9BACT|nr:prolyl oligopeptidase family serine peptidase [Halalkalibaculum roseum]NGP76123.1 prolyl oligopeptidase family serine peptidase [Halalkalibaculum roseum]
MKYLTTLLFSLTIILYIAPSDLLAQEADPAKWTVEDVIKQESAYSLEFSPDGSSLVWVKRRADKEEDKFITDLYLTRLDVTEDDTFKTVQLTRGKESDNSPLFSRDGKTIYFLSSREEGKKLWAMSIYGGEPYEVHTFESGISDIQWLGDDKLAFESDEGKTLYEMKLEEAKDNTVVVEDTAHFKASRIYSFDLESKEISRLTDNEFPVGEYRVSKNGKHLVTSHILSPDYGADANPKPTYYLWDLETGEKQQILKDGYQTPGNFEFTENNEGFYFVSVKSSDPEWNGAGITLLYYYNLADNTVKNVPVDWDWGLGSGFDLIGNDLIVGLANGATVKLAYMEKTGNGWNKKEVDAGEMDERVSIVAVGKEGKNVAYVYSTASTPPQYRLASLKKGRNNVSLPEGEELFKLNKHLDKKTKARTEVVTWTGAMDDEINGILYYPHNYQEGRAYPLVVTIHGGPSGVDTDSWNESWTDFNNIMAQKGAFVLQPNYHGSSNHGLEFVESIKGHYYEYEVPDVISGVEMLIDKGMVDRDSLGVKGWSNGAIITTMLTIQYPEMFKVAAPGAGDVNWTSDYGTCRFGVSFDQSYFGGAPWDNTDGKIYNTTYIQKSPLFEMEKVRTPTLIHHGSEDRAVPRDQGWEYYRALQQIEKAPVRFLWYPGQPHGLQKVTHQTRKMEEEIRWFDTYLFGTYEPENEAFKEESPLAEILKKDKIQMNEGLYGMVAGGSLIPETNRIKEDSIAIGRFEVTNAQFAAYDQNHSYPAVRANYPATGITVEDAIAYTEWLSSLTGNTYRLPNSDEATSLHKQAKKTAANENTLNYWAGYEITIDEVPELREKMGELQHSLLKESGSYKGTKLGEALIYDLGGNASEYQEDGSSYGYSAVSYVDERGEVKEAPLSYTGFRVIME